jgi:hypothetical protein
VGAQSDPVAQIQSLVQAGQYRIRLHTARHMIEEGFDENHILEVINGTLRMVEEYPDESRYLVVGYFHFTPKARSPLHLVCDLSQPNIVDIVTAYIPQRPWWINPTQRGERE